MSLNKLKEQLHLLHDILEMHEILEDCQHYFECERQDDETFIQRNWMCEDNLVFTNKLGRCSDPDQAPECKAFENLKCKLECPRIFFTSSGIASSSQPESLGCYRLKGSKDPLIVSLAFRYTKCPAMSRILYQNVL